MSGSNSNLQKKVSSNDSSVTTTIIREFSKKIESRQNNKSPIPKQIISTRLNSKGPMMATTTMSNLSKKPNKTPTNNISYIQENFECLTNNMNITKENLDISCIEKTASNITSANIGIGAGGIKGISTTSTSSLNTKIGRNVSEKRYSNNYIKKLDGNEKHEKHKDKMNKIDKLSSVKKPTSVKNFFDLGGNIGDEISNSDDTVILIAYKLYRVVVYYMANV